MKLKRGDTRTLEFPVRDVATGAPYPLGPPSTAAWWMGTLAYRKASVLIPAVVLLQKSTGNGLTIATEVEGAATLYVVTIDLAPGDTKTLVPGSYYHEVQVTDADGNIQTLELDDGGRFDLLQDLVVL